MRTSCWLVFVVGVLAVSHVGGVRAEPPDASTMTPDAPSEDGPAPPSDVTTPGEPGESPSPSTADKAQDATQGAAPDAEGVAPDAGEPGATDERNGDAGPSPDGETAPPHDVEAGDEAGAEAGDEHGGPGSPDDPGSGLDGPDGVPEAEAASQDGAAPETDEAGGADPGSPAEDAVPTDPVTPVAEDRVDPDVEPPSPTPNLTPPAALPPVTVLPDWHAQGGDDFFSAALARPDAVTDATEALTTADAIKAILGLLVLLALAYVAGHPVVQRLERRLRISQVITAGFPFVIFGVIASMDSVGVLSAPAMKAISPLLPLGLGWIGFAIGVRFTVEKPAGDAAPLVRSFFVTAALPFGLIVGAAWLLLVIAEGGVMADASFLRDAFILATAGAMTAKSLPAIVASRGASDAAVQRMRHVIQLEEMSAFAGLILIAAFFRPETADVGWHLPSVGWIFVTIGVGSALGVVAFAALGAVKGQTETMVVTLGAIAFAAGMASYLRISPIVVCFLAGALLSNLPGAWKDQVRQVVGRLERPIYLIFLMIAGAMWPVEDPRGWLLMALFVAARFGGRLLGMRLIVRRPDNVLTPLEQRALAASPMGALSIAIVMNAQDLYTGASTSWIVTAILGGAIVTEFITQVSAFATQRLFPDVAPPPAPGHVTGDGGPSAPTGATTDTTDTFLKPGIVRPEALDDDATLGGPASRGPAASPEGPKPGVDGPSETAGDEAAIAPMGEAPAGETEASEEAQGEAEAREERKGDEGPAQGHPPEGR